MVSFRVAAISLGQNGCDDADPFDVYLGAPDKCSFKLGDVCGGEIFTLSVET